MQYLNNVYGLRQIISNERIKLTGQFTKVIFELQSNIYVFQRKPFPNGINYQIKWFQHKLSTIKRQKSSRTLIDKKLFRQVNISSGNYQHAYFNASNSTFFF